MDIYQILDKRSCSVELEAKNKDDVVRELAELAVKSESTAGVTANKIYTALAEREAQGSTGFGNEIAIPHARIEGMSDFLLFMAVSPKGVEFGALDKKKVRIFFVILGPPSGVNDHLKILAFVSRAIGHTNVKRELIQSRSVTALYEAFLRNSDTAPSESKEQRAIKLLIVVLYDEDFMYRILEVFIEEGIEGATILDGAGMGQYISNVPLFADFIGFMRENKHKSKTIFVMVPEEHLEDVVRRIEDVTGDLDKKQGAMVMALDIGYFKGTMRMI